MLLTDEERCKFALYLRQGVESDEQLLKASANLSRMKPMQDMLKSRINAQRLVADMLESVENQEIRA